VARAGLDWCIVDADVARPVEQAGDAPEQARLAGGVRADHRRDLAALQHGRGHAGEHLLLAVADADLVELQGRYHARLRLDMMRLKRNGTPTRAVMMPMGKMVPGTMDLLITEVSDRIAAPDRTEAGRK
jgi:hypothetical protein